MCKAFETKTQAGVTCVSLSQWETTGAEVVLQIFEQRYRVIWRNHNLPLTWLSYHLSKTTRVLTGFVGLK